MFLSELLKWGGKDRTIEREGGRERRGERKQISEK